MKVPGNLELVMNSLLMYHRMTARIKTRRRIIYAALHSLEDLWNINVLRFLLDATLHVSVKDNVA